MEMPGISADERVVVVAGCPNVGKSQLVARISSGKPEVASYPFTTKAVSLGHMHIGHERVQVMDTPGLLDRDLEDRNKIELQAITALEHLADAILFVFDPSETCGYPLASQEHLLSVIREQFSQVPVIVASNKSDLGVPGPGLAVSALMGSGFEALMAEIARNLASAERRPRVG
jgi:nucleolar GTP-binding protein